MIPYGRQSINDADISAVVSALKGEFLTTGPLVDKFESELERVVGAPCVVVSSGTAALHCAYAAIGIEPGDEIITPPMTFIATQATAAMFGAKIVFVDIQSETGNIDPNAAEAAITNRTKAIVAVDYAGHPADLDELRRISDRYGIYLIEDAAHAIGSTYENRPVGSIADITTFSFFPTKNMTTGEGGAISSKDPYLLLRARRFSHQGLVRDKTEFKISNQGPWHQEVHEFGLNYRLPDILCALGSSQLQRLKEFKEKRTQIFNQYLSTFGNNSRVTLPKVKGYVDPMWHLFALRVDPKVRTLVHRNLHSAGIAVQVNYMPAHWHPVWKGEFLVSDFPISNQFYKSEISLPMHVSVTMETIERTVSIIQETTSE